MLELLVRVININLEEHHEILDKCPVLKQYSQFMDRIRKNQEDGQPEAYNRAIKACIEQDILKDYLRRKRNEVCNMLIADYNYELDMEVQREEAREEGFAEGRAELEEKLIRQNYRKGKSEQELADIFDVSIDRVRKILKTA